MANLFGKNKLREIAEAIDTDSVQDFIAVVKNWQQDYHNGSLKKDKETSREQQYNRDFFLDILGYKEKPASPFSFEPKATTDKGQLPDAVISHTDTVKNIRNIAAVVELKGASIDLDRPQRREGNMSPVQQGFKYKTQYRSVPFVIVSNFWEFRLYHDNLLDYEVWTLDDLVNPADDYLLFKTWFALLKKDSLTTAKGVSKTEALLSDIRIEQENIGKKFYKVYKEARLNLLRDIYSQNDHIKTDIDTGIQKAQKIIDRVVFAAFAEDRGLLPDNTLQRVIKAADSSVYGGSLWNTLKGFFEAIDVGSDKLEIPNGYNGGLFKHDEVLNNLRISDEPLRKVVELGTYNYAEDLSVNILGHIFEQSISDLEEIKNKVNEGNSLETLSQSRRKKDGIFYTPDYIVRYIVDNSLGAYLREHEEKFKAEFGLKGDILDKTYEKRERQAYTKYQDFLQSVKVVDPACGSGAFLVYVFDYLLAENKRVGDILGMSLFSSDEYVRDILRNNIYGVDLNEESVEITKLSLWLKTAQKGKKLTTLDNNIKCGNSLIDDINVASEKAFNWQEQFADVFKNGGFDVVIGNPPYVDSESMVKHDPMARTYISTKYKHAKGNWDLLIPFIELALDMLKPFGRMSFITSNKWLALDYGASIRTRILPHLTAIVDCTMENVFESANVSSVVFAASNNISKTIEIGGLNSGVLTSERRHIKNNSDEQISLENNLSLIFSPSLSLITRLNISDRLVNMESLAISGAFTTGEAYQLIDYVKEGGANPPNTQLKLVNTGTIDRYAPLWGLTQFNYLKGKYEYPVIEKARFQQAFPRRFEKLNKPKILITGIRHFETFLDYDNEYVSTKSTVVITGDMSQLEWLVAVLNSKLVKFYIRANYLASSMGGGINFTPDLIRNLPVPKIDSDVSGKLSQGAKRLHQKTLALYRLNGRFESLIASEFGIEKMPTKLKTWWTLDFTEFVKILKVKLSLQQKDELLHLFEKYRIELSALDVEIKNTNIEIDQLVYALYDLALEEISIVESNV
jgi:type I restriction-modification system DNA methylase subunit